MKNNINQFRKSVGYVQQDPYLFRGTVYKNIEIGLKLNHINQKRRIKKVSKILSLLKIEYLSTRLAHSLSGGETKKVAIGQAMVLEPDVLIMDEPFSSLDKDSIYDLEELITFLRTELNKTIIFTTHDQIQAQKLTDHIYTIVKGKLFPTHLINLFSGKFDESNKVFDTGKQLITIDNGADNLELIAIDPRQIVLSLQELDSSMQNSFLGKITGIIEDSNNIKLNIDIGEKIQAIITHKAFSDLKLSLRMNVWVSFKSSSIMIF
jgi:molybdopterin-binding protein